jgi:protein phosphatase
MLSSLVPAPRRMLRVVVGSRCVKGSLREVNEDRCYADQRRGVFLVADGEGMHAAGERASQTVMEVITASLSELLDRVLLSRAVLAGKLRDAFFHANRELMAIAASDTRCSDMGTTAVVGVVFQSRLLLCSVGDSRAYLYRAERLTQLTIDDTLVQELVSGGALTSGEAARHPMRDVLSHSVCTRELSKLLEVATFALQPGDRLVFATDGLTDVVKSDVLATQLARGADPHATAWMLVDIAQASGSRDNITCIVVDLHAASA